VHFRKAAMSDMKKHDVTGYAFGALVATGGIMGFVKKRSLPSLLAGVTFGGLAAFGAYDASENPDTPYVGAAVSGLLGTAMGARALKSKSFMPAGAVSILSLAMLTKYSLAIYEGKLGKTEK